MNNFQQFITSNTKNLSIYVNEADLKFSSLLSAISDPKPFFHSLFLLELLRIQQDGAVKTILNRLESSIDNLNYTLNLELEDFIKHNSVGFTEDKTVSLKKIINEKYMDLPGIDGDITTISQLIGIIDCVGITESQYRSFDEFAKVFFLNVKMFKFANEQKIPAAMKPMSLSTMEIAWAYHSEQQDTLFQILFNNITEWSQMKMFGIGI